MVLKVSNIFLKKIFFHLLKIIFLKNFIESNLNNNTKQNKKFKIFYFLKKKQSFFIFYNYFNIDVNIATILSTLLKFNTYKKNDKKKKNKISNELKKINVNIFYKNKNSNENNFKNKVSSYIYKVDSFLKNIHTRNNININIQFLRKFRVFNKSRYSRNRQFYRTGVYWCLYINIIAVIGIYFWFYKITINYTYLWFIFYLFFLSFVISRLFNFISFFSIKLHFLKWNLMLFNQLKLKLLFIINFLFRKIIFFFL